MAQPIIVTVSHSLGAAEAQKRIVAAMEKATSEFGAVVSSLEAVWTGNHADIVVVALSQRILAKLDITENAVRIEVNLPWYFAPLQEKIASIVQKRSEKLLQIAHG